LKYPITLLVVGLMAVKAGGHFDRKSAGQFSIISLVFGLFNLRNTIIYSIRSNKQNQKSQGTSTINVSFWADKFRAELERY